VRGYVAAAISRFGRIDAFFNNAGILGAVAPTIDYPIDTFDRSSQSICAVCSSACASCYRS
jgi:NAD(P)-dependent dehydrogenase (short-subunit alcohol dehydrogenase family)